jgi:hypothetical protein
MGCFQHQYWSDDWVEMPKGLQGDFIGRTEQAVQAHRAGTPLRI